jgi:GH24 family phage-related lysozyme (muramidase)
MTTTAKVRAAVEHAVRLGQLTPQQLAAFSWLDEQLTAKQAEGFTDLWRASGSPAAPAPPAWTAPALRLIREFEGCRLDAYRCPAGIWTIGWGSTRLIDSPVREGDQISQELADELLANDVEHLFGPGVLTLLPLAKRWRPEQIASITSFAFNVGLGAVEESTLRKRLLAGEDPFKVVREELPKWCHAGEAVLPGLERRRAAEVALFCGGQAPAPAKAPNANPLKVPYYSQRDSAVSGQAQRMCFSSSCAMLTAYLRPGSITGPNADDQYLKRVQQYGDSTDANAQLKALASYGITARFVQNGDWADLERQISRGVPIPCGFLHHGLSTAPSGGGHWLTVIGLTPSAAIVNDPWGEMLVAQGTYTSSRGAGLAYSRKNWGPRWLVEGPRSGWAIIAEP